MIKSIKKDYSFEKSTLYNFLSNYKIISKTVLVTYLKKIEVVDLILIKGMLGERYERIYADQLNNSFSN